MFGSCSKLCLLVFRLITFIELSKTNSIINNVKLHNIELRPPTLQNLSTAASDDTSNNKVKFPAPNYGIPNETSKTDSNWHSFLPNSETIIGNTATTLTGVTEIDNVETLLGDTVADAFLMNSWDDTEIR